MQSMTLRAKLTIILVVFLVIGIVNAAIILLVVQQQKANARAINLAGRQRMLSQKMSKESFILLTASTEDEEAQYKAEMEKTSELFDRTLKGLIQGDREQGLAPCNDDKVRQKLEEVRLLWTPFYGQIKTLMKSGPNSPAGQTALKAIRAGNLPLLKAMDEAVQFFEKSNNLDTIATVQGILLFITMATAALAWYLSQQFIIRPLKRFTGTLDTSAEEIGTAAATVSEGAQTLADQASSQAAAVEESSASLEEITAISKQNADNTSEANNLMQETQHIVEKAYNYMEQMKNSMDDIAASGQEISKIIKAIDEIAFQTNLLSLNAAVEAARAGEAGAGFAVVADEVRNLALRAAEAAKNTSTLIEGVVRKIAGGADLVEKATESFHEVAGSSQKVANLTKEIAQSLQEQSGGITQINLAITEMDTVTQQNAATSEESAAAAKDLHRQAVQMVDIVERLTMLVEGQHAGHQAGAAAPAKAAPLQPKRPAPQVPVKKALRPSPAKPAAKKLPAPPKETPPPASHTDFQDF